MKNEELDNLALDYLQQSFKTKLKEFLQNELKLNIEERDICSGPKWYNYKPRWFNYWGKLSYDDLTKIKEFLHAKTLMIYNYPGEERGWEPLVVLIVYEEDKLEELEDYFPK